VKIMTEENQSTTRKTCPGVAVLTTKPTRTDLGLKEQRHVIMPLRCDKASSIIISHTKGSYLFRKVDILTPVTFISN
jgi:hypothetical protein